MAEETNKLTKEEAQGRIQKMAAGIERLKEEIGIDFYVIGLGVDIGGSVLAGVAVHGSAGQMETALMACMDAVAGTVADEMLKRNPPQGAGTGVVH